MVGGYQVTLLREFMSLRQIPVGLRRKLLAQYHHYFHMKTVFDEKELLRIIPSYLKEQLIQHISR
eukprot:COSAG01_NODE_4534_length_4945_cov_171.303756_5_plen_65_part_00